MTALAQSHRFDRSVSVPSPAFQMPIRCLSGAVWITQEGSTTDTVLPAGEACKLRGKGLVLLSAVPEAELRLGNGAS